MSNHSTKPWADGGKRIDARVATQCERSPVDTHGSRLEEFWVFVVVWVMIAGGLFPGVMGVFASVVAVSSGSGASATLLVALAWGILGLVPGMIVSVIVAFLLAVLFDFVLWTLSADPRHPVVGGFVGGLTAFVCCSLAHVPIAYSEQVPWIFCCGCCVLR